jgi:hypothetical protein
MSTKALLSQAAIDQEAFYPFRQLVEGPLEDPRYLPLIERFLRAAVVHDRMFMDLEPVPGPDDESLWERGRQASRCPCSHCRLRSKP